jgi:hypothetical protein
LEVQWKISDEPQGLKMAENTTAKPVKRSTIMGKNLSSHERPPRSGVTAMETQPI